MDLIHVSPGFFSGFIFSLTHVFYALTGLPVLFFACLPMLVAIGILDKKKGLHVPIFFYLAFIATSLLVIKFGVSIGPSITQSIWTAQEAYVNAILVDGEANVSEYASPFAVNSHYRDTQTINYRATFVALTMIFIFAWIGNKYAGLVLCVGAGVFVSLFFMFIHLLGGAGQSFFKRSATQIYAQVQVEIPKETIQHIEKHCPDAHSLIYHRNGRTKQFIVSHEECPSVRERVSPYRNADAKQWMAEHDPNHHLESIKLFWKGNQSASEAKVFVNGFWNSYRNGSGLEHEEFTNGVQIILNGIHKQ